MEDTGTISKTEYCGNPLRNSVYILRVTVNLPPLDSVTVKLVKFVRKHAVHVRLCCKLQPASEHFIQLIQ
jgi:hypothetical protein